MTIATLNYSRFGFYISWYRDDDNNSGYGNHPQVNYWPGSRAECIERMKQPAPITGWEPLRTDAIDELKNHLDGE